jgi:hypothetical protein
VVAESRKKTWTTIEFRVAGSAPEILRVLYRNSSDVLLTQVTVDITAFWGAMPH